MPVGFKRVLLAQSVFTSCALRPERNFVHELNRRSANQTRSGFGDGRLSLEEVVSRKRVTTKTGDQKANSATDSASCPVDNNLHLHMLPERPAIEGGRCVDGTQAGYYYAPPNCGESSTTWVFYMNGGGACEDVDDCRVWMNLSAGSGATQAPKGSSGWRHGEHDVRYWKETAQGKEFLSASPALNPHFHDTHRVRIPYCSGDSHAGTAVHEDLFITGHLNFKRIIRDIATNYPDAWGTAKQILLWGVSAGGKGVVVNCDWLARAVKKMGLPANAVKCAPHSSMFYPAYWADTKNSDPDPFLPPLDYVSWQNEADRPEPLDTDFYHSYIPPECQDGNYCRSAGNIYKYIQAPVYMIQDEFDTAPLQGLDFPWQTEEKETEQGQTYVSLFGASVRNTMKNHKEGDGVYLTSCFQHGSHIANVNNGDISYQDSLADWFFEKGDLPHVLMDDCSEETGLPCNPKCANLDSSTCLLQFSTVCQEQRGSKAECMDCAGAWDEQLVAAGCTDEELNSIFDSDTCG